MPRTPLKSYLSWLALTFAVAATCGAGGAVNPHVDPTLNSGGCASCHAGHGASNSPMLPEAQIDVCMRCHGSRADVNGEIQSGRLGAGAEPPLLADVLAKPFSHRMSRTAFSRRDGESTCTSCHSPHRSEPHNRSNGELSGTRHLSPRNPEQFEYELCQECHGSGGSSTRDLTDISRLFDLSNRSYHPVQAPATERSPSIIDELAGREINCTDCHGNDDPKGPRGIHGSNIRYLLRASYSTVDGEGSDEDAALCFVCHKREKVLDESSLFPFHGLHVSKLGASCATCHSAHGSVDNRALIRFGEETSIGGVAPSMTTGTLAFESESQAGGACYLTCHGVDHGPEAYGFMRERLKWLRVGGAISPQPVSSSQQRQSPPQR